MSQSPDKPQFRGGNNTLFTKGLFFETTLADKSSVLYTLKDWDHTADGKVYPSLYRLYLETNDPTEYRFAVTHLDGLYHWEVLQNCSWFEPYIQRWRRELELKMKSEALAGIMREAKTSSRDAFNAKKYLLEKAWEPKEANKNSRGRPSKDEVKKAATELARASETLSDDFTRIFQKAN